MALHKAALQSTEAGDGGLPYLAVDGVYSSESVDCTKTAWSQKPWWSVNLGKKYRIDMVAVTTSAAPCE